MTEKYKPLFVDPAFHKKVKKLSAEKGVSIVQLSKEMADKMEITKQEGKKPNYMKLI